MKTQSIIEVQKNSTYTFEHFIESKNTAIIPSTANITIMDKSGTEILASTAMTINGTSGLCTYDWDSTGNDTGFNYQVKFELDSYDPVIRLFDIVLYPFVNNVTDSDLILENRSLETSYAEVSGSATGGTTSTIVDAKRFEADDYYNGGVITIYKDNDVYERTITDYVSSTKTFTFTPVLDFTPTDEEYTARTSFQDGIDLAGTKVQLYFRKLEKRASLIMDSYTCKQLIIYKFFENYYFTLMKEEGDEFSIKHSYYQRLYQTEMESLNLVYDINGDGSITEAEEDRNIGQIRWYR